MIYWLLNGFSKKKANPPSIPIAHAPDRETGVLIDVAAVHVGGGIEQVAVVRVGTSGLGSAPKVGVEAEIVVGGGVAASG